MAAAELTHDVATGRPEMMLGVNARLAASRISMAEDARTGGTGGGAAGDDLAFKLAALVRRKGVRVLIVHGKDDMLVPAVNSERLTRMLPPFCGCELVTMERTGHVPHEERPELFTAIVSEFVSRGADA